MADQPDATKSQIDGTSGVSDGTFGNYDGTFSLVISIKAIINSVIAEISDGTWVFSGLPPYSVLTGLHLTNIKNRFNHLVLNLIIIIG